MWDDPSDDPDTRGFELRSAASLGRWGGCLPGPAVLRNCGACGPSDTRSCVLLDLDAKTHCWVAARTSLCSLLQGCRGTLRTKKSYPVRMELPAGPPLGFQPIQSVAYCHSVEQGLCDFLSNTILLKITQLLREGNDLKIHSTEAQNDSAESPGCGPAPVTEHSGSPAQVSVG